MKLPLWVTLGAALFAGCDGGIGGQSAPIVQGTPSPDRSVVWVAATTGTGSAEVSDGVCSGTIIGARLVLTARHCIQDPSVNGGAVFAPEHVVVGTSDTAPDAAPELRRLGVSPLRVVTDISPNLRLEPTESYRDVAVLVFSAANGARLLGSATPRTLSTVAPMSLVGTEVDQIGFGETERGTIGTRLARRGVVSEAEPEGFVRTGSLGMLVVDGPTVCGGDSGGPALDANGAVAGVLSFGAAVECASVDDYAAYVLVNDSQTQAILRFAQEHLNDACAAEVCDSVDDEDCDGRVDEGCMGSTPECDLSTPCEVGFCVEGVCVLDADSGAALPLDASAQRDAAVVIDGAAVDAVPLDTAAIDAAEPADAGMHPSSGCGCSLEDRAASGTSWAYALVLMAFARRQRRGAERTTYRLRRSRARG